MCARPWAHPARHRRRATVRFGSERRPAIYMTLATWYPAPGKEGDLLALATTFVQERQGCGERYSLSTRLYSPIGQTITVARPFPDLAAAEVAREQNQADASFHEAGARANASSRAPATARLWEVIVWQSAPAGATGAVKFIQTVHIHPATGNLGEVRAVLSERVRGDQERYRAALMIDLYHGDGQIFVVSGGYASLGEVAERRAAQAADRQWIEDIAAINKLCRKPAPAILSAVVVPPPR